MASNNDATDNLYKILGAVALTDQDGAVDRIDPSILRQGDACFCIASTGYYIFRAYESSALPSEKPFSSSNPPLVIQPDVERFGSNTAFRWHLVSSPVFVSDITLANGAKLTCTKIIGDPGLAFYDGSGDKVAEVKQNGTFWVSKLLTGSKDLVENLNANLLEGHTQDEFMTRNGDRAFTNPVSGVNPTKPDHLATKNYVDEKVQVLHPELYIKRDGSTAFEAPQSGMDPTLPDHLTTKRYVDESLNATINKLFEMQRFIIYKTGTSSIPVGARRISVTFGGSLSRYAVFATVVNTSETAPYSTTAVISEQYSNYFTADFGGEVPSANYKLNWLIVGIPDGSEELKAGTAPDDKETPSIPIVSGGSGKTVLQENTNVFVSGKTGNDSNDGLTQFSPKKTVAGLLSLLNSFDTNGFKVKVLVITEMPEVESLWFIPGYSSNNLEITRGNNAPDKVFPSKVTIASGGCTFRNIKFKTLDVLENASVLCKESIFEPTNSTPACINYGTLKFTGIISLQSNAPSLVRTFGKTEFSEVTLNGSGALESLVESNRGFVYFNNFVSKLEAKYSATLKNGGAVVGITKDFPGNGLINSSEPATVSSVPAVWKHAAQHKKNGIDPIFPSDIGALGSNESAIAAKKWNREITLELVGSLSGSVSFDGSKNVKLTATLKSTDAIISGLSEHVNATSAHEATWKLKANRIVLRDENGRAQFEEGVKANDVVIKGQLDLLEKSLTKQDEDVLEQALNADLIQVQGVGTDSFWCRTGNILMCWGKVKFIKGEAVVTLPYEFASTNYMVSFGATLGIPDEIPSFALTAKNSDSFTASSYPAISADHTYFAIGLC